MSDKPVFVATHPRACSTAFERVFMTRSDILKCVHEPFGDAYYYGPERLALRFAFNEKARVDSGFGDYTFETIMENINQDNKEAKRILIKDMAQNFIPPNHKPPSIAPSLLKKGKDVGTNGINGSKDHGTNGIHENGSNAENGDKPPTAAELPAYPKGRRGSQIDTQVPLNPAYRILTTAGTPYPTPSEPNNPTVVPEALWEQFHFAFLIRHPRNSIPSYYRCTIPPLDSMTGFYNFRPDEAGYYELRRFFDYLLSMGLVGPRVATQPGTIAMEGIHENIGLEICVIDADDLLDKPAEVIEAFCNSVGIDYRPEMLVWDTEDDHNQAARAFEKWKGFHEDAIESHDLKPRANAEKKRAKTDYEYYKDWENMYGKEAAELIRRTVDENVAHYEYLKSFAIKV